MPALYKGANIGKSDYSKKSVDYLGKYYFEMIMEIATIKKIQRNVKTCCFL